MDSAPTILVADDEEVVLNFVTMVLQRAGYRVLAASGGALALNLTNRGAEVIDLALLDVVMPEMDGPSLCAALREHYPGLGVLFMSGFNEDEVYRRCGGTLDFLKKAFYSRGTAGSRAAVDRSTAHFACLIRVPAYDRCSGYSTGRLDILQ